MILDVVMLALVVAGCIVAAGYAGACDRLMGVDQASEPPRQ